MKAETKNNNTGKSGDSTPESISKSEKRRKLVKVLGASGGVAIASAGSKWVSPAIESVVIPAHAQMSEIRGVVSVTTTSVFDNISDIFLESAVASHGTPGTCEVPHNFCLDITSANGIIMITLFGQTVAPQEGTVTFTNGVQFTVTAAGVSNNSSTNTYVIMATITGDTISGTISCTGNGKNPSGNFSFSGQVEQGVCATI